ncbi:MAG: hypothetical protein Q8Q95_01235 [bacterium]|nr:hypothetical protein [bacterium]
MTVAIQGFFNKEVFAMSAKTNKIVRQADVANERKQFVHMRQTAIGKEEVMVLRDEETGGYGVLCPGDKILTFLYTQAKASGMVLAPGQIFRYKEGSGGHQLECWITCYLDHNGCARYSRDDATQKARRERIQDESMEMAGLKRHGLGDDAIKTLKMATRVGLILPSVVWLANALQMQGGGSVVRNLLTFVFKGAGKFVEEDFRSVLDHIGFEPPTETGRDFVSVCFGVKALLVNINFGGIGVVKGLVDSNTTAEVVEDLAEGEIGVDGDPVGNGHLEAEEEAELVGTN